MSEYLITDKRFLIVDDNILSRNIAQDILLYYGAKTEMAINGVEALEKIKKHDSNYYDVILLDIYLPDMLGYEIADKIREIPGCEKDKLKIVALSVSQYKDGMGRSLNAYCRKPLTIPELLIALQ